MPSPERKKNKHKKKDKDSSHRSSPKHKSKKKVSFFSNIRNLQEHQVEEKKRITKKRLRNLLIIHRL